jgi:hypothetical protein
VLNQPSSPYALRQKKRQKMRIYDAPHSQTVATM